MFYSPPIDEIHVQDIGDVNGPDLAYWSADDYNQSMRPKPDHE